MTNPAQELWTIIEHWRAQEQPNAESTRGFKKSGEEERHVDAAKSLHEIKGQLEVWDAQGRTAITPPFWTMWHSLVKAVFVWPRGWNANQPQAGRRFDPSSLDQLRLLAEMLESKPSGTGFKIEESTAALLDWLEGIKVLAHEDTELANYFSDQVTALCDEISSAARGENHVSAAEFVELLNEMWRHCATAARSETDKHSEWRSKRSTAGAFVAGFGLNLVSNAAWHPIGLLLSGS